MLKTHSLLAGVLAVAAAVGTSACTSKVDDKKKDTTPLATFAGEKPVTAGDLDEKVGKDVKQAEREFRDQVYQMKRQALEQMVVERLLEKKAKEAGVSKDEYLKRLNQEIAQQLTDPTPQEVQQFYDGYAAQATRQGQQIPPLDQVRDQVAMAIKNQKGNALASKRIEALKAEAKVEILLDPPRTTVDAKGPSKGPEKAPITIVEFSDFQCPFCVRAEPVVAQILDTYKDQVRLVYRDYPLPFHPFAQKAAEAAQCADAQGKYWPMHERLFKAGGTDLAVENLKAYAKELGLDQGKFDKCLDDGEKKDVVKANQQAGEDAGVNSTPAFFINGRLVAGALPFEQFKEIIDSELKAKGLTAKK